MPNQMSFVNTRVRKINGMYIYVTPLPLFIECVTSCQVRNIPQSVGLSRKSTFSLAPYRRTLMELLREAWIMVQVHNTS